MSKESDGKAAKAYKPTPLEKLAKTIYDMGQKGKRGTWRSLERELENASGLMGDIDEQAGICDARLNKMAKRVRSLKRYLVGSKSSKKAGYPPHLEKLGNELLSSISARVVEVAILEDISQRFIMCDEDEENLSGLRHLKRKLQKHS